MWSVHAFNDICGWTTYIIKSMNLNSDFCLYFEAEGVCCYIKVHSLICSIFIHNGYN